MNQLIFWQRLSNLYSFLFQFITPLFLILSLSSFSDAFPLEMQQRIQRGEIIANTMESTNYHINLRCGSPTNPTVLLCEIQMKHKQDSSKNHAGVFIFPKAGKVSTDYIGVGFIKQITPEIFSHGKVFFTANGKTLIFQISEQEIRVPVASMTSKQIAPIIYCAVDGNYPKAYYLIDHFNESHHAVGITDKSLPAYLSIINDNKSENLEDQSGDLIESYLRDDLLSYQYGEILLQAFLDKGCNPVNLLKSPTNIRTISADKKVELTWKGLNTASQYNIYYSTIANIHRGASEVNQVSTQNTHLTVIGLNNNVSYYFALSVEKNGIESPLSIEVSATPKAEITAINSMKALSDTNITRCANKDSNDLDCPVSSFPEQDAESGRNRQSFSKISKGQCVQDNITGLIWEVKQDKNDQVGESLHDADDFYTWYEPDNSKNGGEVGFEHHPNDANTCYGYQSNNNSRYCNTLAYVQRVNAKGWCGYQDWRIPTLGELRSIVDRGRTGPAINTVYFPNANNAYVWSSSPSARDSTSAWRIYFYLGYNTVNGKGVPAFVRLVRSN